MLYVINMKGKVITYYGKGEGKTSAALGHAVRLLGYDKKVAIIQFMKGRYDTGEFNFFKRIKNIEIFLCGAPKFLKKNQYRKEHLEKVNQGMGIAKVIVTQQKIDLLILDEILYAIKFKLLEEKELLNLLDKRKRINIILTGRNPSKQVLKRSDITSEFREIKHHYKKDKKTVKGLDY